MLSIIDYFTAICFQMIPPRGCAYVVMQKRKDAYRVVDRLKGSKLNGSSLKVSTRLAKSSNQSPEIYIILRVFEVE